MRHFWLHSIESDWRIGDYSFLIEKLPFLQKSINTMHLLSFLLPPACDLSRTVCRVNPVFVCDDRAVLKPESDLTDFGGFP